MQKNERRVSVDSCVFVNVLTAGGADNENWLSASSRLLQAAEAGQFAIFISAITVPEVFGSGRVRGNHLVKAVRAANVARAREWMLSGRFKLVEADALLARQAAELAVDHQLSGADAVILASAIRVKSEVLYSWDRDLLKIGSIDGLRIATPDKAILTDDLLTGLDHVGDAAW